MRQFRQCFNFSFLVICVLLILFVAISVRGEDVPKGGPSKPLTTIPNRFDIHGNVMDATPDLSHETFTKLATSESQNDFEQTLSGILNDRPVPNVVVTAKGDSVMEKAVTDSQGKFEFIGLPGGEYEFSAEMPLRSSETGVKRMATAKKRVRLVKTSGIIKLVLHADLVAVRGQITDVHGQPVAGAKVTGKPYPFPEVGIPDTVSHISNADGSYELKWFVPPNIYRTAGYLNGGSLNAPGSLYTCVEICVEADGFIQDKKNVPRVPLVTKELLDPARRLLKIMSQLNSKKGYPELREKDDLSLPSSKGNTITGIDIVLKKVADGGQ